MVRSVCLERDVSRACRLLPELWQALAESLWGCVFAASPEVLARPAANHHQQSAEDAVHTYISIANHYEFYQKDADLIFPTGLVEVMSRAQSSKTALSCSGFFNLLASENNIFAFLGSSLVQNTY